MRVLVCGGRDYVDEARVHRELNSLSSANGWLTVIEGGSRGADRFAQNWAKQNYHGLVTIEAEWKKYGNAAGPIRNQLMLDRCIPDIVLAFPGNRGTKDMTERAQVAGVVIKWCGRDQKGLGLT